MFLEGGVGTEGFITAIAGERTQPGMGVQMNLQLSSPLKLFIARLNGTGQFRSRSRLARVAFDVLSQIVFAGEDLVAILKSQSKVSRSIHNSINQL